MSLANDELAHHTWGYLYLQAVLETDNSVLRARIEAAQAAINERVEELARDHEGGTEQERQAISDALRGLVLLRRQRAS